MNSCWRELDIVCGYTREWICSIWILSISWSRQHICANSLNICTQTFYVSELRTDHILKLILLLSWDFHFVNTSEEWLYKLASFASTAIMSHERQEIRLPDSSANNTSAPLLSNNCTTDTRPCLAAMCRGLKPYKQMFSNLIIKSLLNMKSPVRVSWKSLLSWIFRYHKNT